VYKVIVHKRAQRYLNKLKLDQKKKVIKCLTELAADPFQNKNVKQMFGNWKGHYRMRVGTMRVIFWIDQSEKLIYIDHVGPRGDVYK